MRNTIKAVLSLVLAGACSGYATADAQPFPAPIRLAADDHAGHQHEAHQGARKELGSKEIAGYSVKVMQESPVHAGEEAAFAIVLSGKKEKPKAIRAWVGVQDAEGSVKGKAVPEKDEWHAHLEVPTPIPPQSQLWVEIETEAGKKKAAFDYK